MERSEQTIESLDPYPDLQANYIENMLENELKDREYQVDTPVKLLFLKLKCENEPDDVVKVLNRYKFPLDESLKVCKDFDNSLAIAHITNRLGLIEEATDEYLKVRLLLL